MINKYNLGGLDNSTLVVWLTISRTLRKPNDYQEVRIIGSSEEVIER